MSDLKTRLLDRIKKHFANASVKIVFDELVYTHINHVTAHPARLATFPNKPESSGLVWQESRRTTIRIGVEPNSTWIVELHLEQKAGEPERIFKISFPIISDYEFVFTNESALDGHALTLLDAVLTSDKGQELTETPQ